MSAEIFDPKTAPLGSTSPPGSASPTASASLDVTMTARAIAHVKRQLARMPGKTLRLGIKESGCSGYMYQLDYIDAPDPDDRVCDVGDALRLYIRNQHLALVRGTEIDFVTAGLNSALKFQNPNAESECGCGESFSVGKKASA